MKNNPTNKNKANRNKSAASNVMYCNFFGGIDIGWCKLIHRALKLSLPAFCIGLRRSSITRRCPVLISTVP